MLESATRCWMSRIECGYQSAAKSQEEGKLDKADA